MMEDLFDLKGKICIVTGSCGTLGSKFCEGLAYYNGQVVVSDIDEKGVKTLADSIYEKYKVETLPLILDITDEVSVEEGISKTLEKFGRVDVLINNAYPKNKNWGTRFEDIEYQSWCENVDMHLNGYFLVTKLFAKEMMKLNSGNIINMGSIYGIVGPDFSIYEGSRLTNPPEYSAIKGGVINFTRYLATYLAKYNIRVNCVSPGGVFTGQEKEFVEKYSKKTPLGRMAKAEDIVGGIVYLASDASSYVTGHNLVIDGGWTSW